MSSPTVVASHSITPGLLFSRSSAAWAPVAVFAVAFAYLLLCVPDPHFFLESDDQGYQMAMGMAVAKGSLPGFDFISQYGPLVAFFSWAAWLLSGNAVGEIVLCAAGYSAAIALAYRYLARYGNVTAATIGAVILLVLFSRYYKWYYWLLPLVVLVAAQSYAERRSAGDRARFLVVGWGLLVGLSGLFRYDLLIEGAVFGAIVIAAVELTPRGRIRSKLAPASRDLAIFVASAIAPPALYCLLILLTRGWHQLSLVLLSVIDGSIDTVVYYGVRPFRFAPGGFSFGNAVAFLQLAIPLTYAAALLRSGRALWSGKPAQRPDAFPLFCTALMGLGLFPQALHRADDQHLLQVLPPFVIVMGLLLARLMDSEPAPERKTVGGLALGTLALALAIVAPRAGNDLASPFRNQIALWRYIAGMPETAREHAVADMAAAIRTLTSPDSTVFLVMPQTRMPMLFFAERRQPGLFPTYEPAMFGGDHWLRENEERLRRAPPDYVVLALGAARRSGVGAPYIPDLLADWQATYRTVVYQNPFFVLLAPNG
ncbi:MAG: hypothetical protein ACM30I_15605 [Gemmatimonas sp.]